MKIIEISIIKAKIAACNFQLLTLDLLSKLIKQTKKVLKI